MSSIVSPIYPACPTIVRTVQIGGLTKPELRQELQHHAISLNESGEQLFAHDQFTTATIHTLVTTIELTVEDLGFAGGAVIADIYARAAELGLACGALELGPHLRLQYLDQPEGYWDAPVRQYQAPYGSITVASVPITDDDSEPKGFYLRRIKGVLWLRGYRSAPQHVWEADDHFVFCQYNSAFATTTEGLSLPTC